MEEGDKWKKQVVQILQGMASLSRRCRYMIATNVTKVYDAVALSSAFFEEKEGKKWNWKNYACRWVWNTLRVKFCQSPRKTD